MAIRKSTALHRDFVPFAAAALLVTSLAGGTLAYATGGGTQGNAAPELLPAPAVAAAETLPEVKIAQAAAGEPMQDLSPKVELLSANEGLVASEVNAAGGATQTADAAEAAPSDAERISRLERAIEDGEQRLAQIKADLADPQGEYALAEAEFKKLDSAIEEARGALRESTEGEDGAATTTAQEAIAQIEPQWKLAKQRFEVELQERRALKENIAVIEQKLQSDRAASEKLKNGSAIADPPATAAGTNATEVPSASGVGSGRKPEQLKQAESGAAGQRTNSTAKAESDAARAGTDGPPSVAVPKGAAPVSAGASESVADAPKPAPTTEAAAKPEKAPTKELIAAQQVAEASAAEAAAAEQAVQSITERIAILQRSVKTERELRDAVRKKVDFTEELLTSLDKQLEEMVGRGEDTEQIRLKISIESQRVREYREESRRVSTQLDKLQSELGKLQAEQLSAFAEAEAKRTIAVEAQEKVEYLNNPFTARNVLQWLLDHGPRLLAVLAAMGTLVWVSRLTQSRLVRLMAGRGPRGNRDERENRAKTLVSVFHNAANLLIIGGGAIMILEEVGIPIGPLVGGAAVVGLAVAFGAQSLIKDYFTGFILLLEQQYLINDVIRVGSISGQVERISLRMTVLRDLEGRVHFIPHGEMNSVTNLTHGWSRAVMEIGVAYKEQVDHVIGVLNELGREMRDDPQFGKLILEDLNMLGVDSLADSAVVIKLFIKTEPLQQWTVKREFLRRVKNRFDQLGIEIPYPHRTVYHRQETSDGQSVDSQQRASGNWPGTRAA